MTDTNEHTARRRELLDAIGKTSELQHHLLLVLAVLLGAQGIVAAQADQLNVLVFVSLIVTVITLGLRLWLFQDRVASLRLRLRPLMQGEEPSPDAKTQNELDWLTQQEPLLERASLWGLWLGAVLFAGGCLV